jgi:hypothetical protein
MVLEGVRRMEQNDRNLVGINRQIVDQLLHANSLVVFNAIFGEELDNVFQVILKIHLPILSDEVWSQRFDGITGSHIWEFWDGYNDGYNHVDLHESQEGPFGQRVYTNAYLRGYGYGRQDKSNSYPNYYIRKYKPYYDTMTGKNNRSKKGKKSNQTKAKKSKKSKGKKAIDRKPKSKAKK